MSSFQIFGDNDDHFLSQALDLLGNDNYLGEVFNKEDDILCSQALDLAENPSENDSIQLKECYRTTIFHGFTRTECFW